MSSSDTHCTKKPRNRSHVTQKSSILDGQFRFSCTRKVAFLSPKHQALHSCTPSHCLRPVTRSYHDIFVWCSQNTQSKRFGAPNLQLQSIYICSRFEFMSVVVFISFYGFFGSRQKPFRQRPPVPSRAASFVGGTLSAHAYFLGRCQVASLCG